MNGTNLPDNIKTCIIEHFEIVSAEFRLYINDVLFLCMQVSWYRNPFNTEIDPNAEEAEFKVSNAMKLAFDDRTDGSSFWLFHIHYSARFL